MSRYAISERRENQVRRLRGVADKPAIEAALGQIARAHTVEILSVASNDDQNEREIYVIDTDDDAIAQRGELLGKQVWLEPEIPHLPQDIIHVQSLANGDPLVAANVIVKFHNGSPQNIQTSEKESDTNGDADIQLSPASTIVELIVQPIDDHWSVVQHSPTRGGVVVPCPRILYPHTQLGWWHYQMGIRQPNPTSGTGIRIGVVDSGTFPHASLPNVTHVGTFRDNIPRPQNPTCRGIHGTHVAGIIAANPVGPTGYWGLAPGAEVYSANVSSSDIVAAQWDIAHAFHFMTQKRDVHIINFSYSARTRSDIVLDAIVDAAANGCICICAAGNSGGAVEWPARWKHAVAVSALGEVGSCPSGTLSSAALPPSGQLGNLQLAKFSCHGSEVNCCAPGVGIVSTVPGDTPNSDWWLPLDGTSMACPAVSGVLARKLATNSTYLHKTGKDRTDLAWAELRAMCRNVQLPIDQQGDGMPYS